MLMMLAALTEAGGSAIYNITARRSSAPAATNKQRSTGN